MPQSHDNYLRVPRRIIYSDVCAARSGFSGVYIPRGLLARALTRASASARTLVPVSSIAFAPLAYICIFPSRLCAMKARHTHTYTCRVDGFLLRVCYARARAINPITLSRRISHFSTTCFSRVTTKGFEPVQRVQRGD